MKMSKRAETAILNTYGPQGLTLPALRGLVQFAAQNSGLDLRNYATPGDRQPGAWRDGYKAYRQEARSINQDWQRFKSALALAAQEGVTDTDLTEAGTRAFSGRLEWNGKNCNGEGIAQAPHWEYTTGQYFPTEYRKAAACVLETATRERQRRRPPLRFTVSSIEQLKALNAKNGGCWFGRGEMAFFGTRIESSIIAGRYFITSEQPPHGPRAYSVRSFDETGSIDTVGQFCAYSSRADALNALRQHQQAQAI